MNPNAFTTEQVKQLSENPYTLFVSTATIRYTREFKERFLELDSEGIGLQACFRLLGYDPEVLGFSRMKSFSTRLKKQARKDGEVCEGNKPKKRHPALSDYGNMPTEEAMIRMQNEILYLHQELDFIKKIIALERSGGQKP